MKKWNVGIVLFNEVEVLDFAGPYEVLSITEIADTGIQPFSVYTVAQSKALISARNGLLVQPHFDFSDAPYFDIVIVPGGYGATDIEFHNDAMIAWIKKQSQQATLMASVCTGSFLLAKAGLLHGKQATTHWRRIDQFQATFPEITVLPDTKFVDEGAIMTSAGISAGIDLCLHLVEKLLDEKTAQETARRMEYGPAA